MQSYPLAPEEVATPGSSLTRLDKFSARIHRFGILLKRRWWFLLLCASATVCYKVWDLARQQIKYSSYGKIVAIGAPNLPQEMQRNLQQVVLANEIEIIQSSEVKRRARDKVASLHPDWAQDNVTVNVYNARGSLSLDFSAEGFRPEYTKAYLQAMMEEFLTYRKELDREGATAAMNLLLEQILRLEKELKDAEQNLMIFQKANPEVSISQGQNQALALARELEGKLRNYISQKELIDRLKLEEDIERRTRMQSGEQPESTLTPEEREMIGVAEVEAKYLESVNKVTLLGAELQSLMETFREQHPQVLTVRTELGKEMNLMKYYEERSRSLAETRRKSLESKIATTEQEAAQWKTKALEISGKINEFETLKEQRARVQQRYDKSLETLRDMDEKKRTAVFETLKILENASDAAEKGIEYIGPVISWAALGLFLGLLVLFLLDQVDDRMNSLSEFQSHFPNLGVLGQIPETSLRGESPVIKPNDDRHLYVEAFRTVRSSILFKNWGPVKPKTLLITSSVPNEGKTTVVANLATTMAIAGARILLVDADLRRGGINELLGAPSRPGFSDILTGKSKWRDLVLSIEVKNLYFIPRGDALDQTSEFFLREETVEFLRETKMEFDFVILDSAPVLVADDTSSIAPKMDAVFLVLRMSSTTARLAAKTFSLLQDRQVNVGGVILNRASANLKEYSYYNYASYYTIQPNAPDPVPTDKSS